MPTLLRINVDSDVLPDVGWLAGRHHGRTAPLNLRRYVRAHGMPSETCIPARQSGRRPAGAPDPLSITSSPWSAVARIPRRTCCGRVRRKRRPRIGSNRLRQVAPHAECAPRGMPHYFATTTSTTGICVAPRSSCRLRASERRTVYLYLGSRSVVNELRLVGRKPRSVGSVTGGVHLTYQAHTMNKACIGTLSLRGVVRRPRSSIPRRAALTLAGSIAAISRMRPYAAQNRVPSNSRPAAPASSRMPVTKTRRSGRGRPGGTIAIKSLLIGAKCEAEVKTNIVTRAKRALTIQLLNRETPAAPSTLYRTREPNNTAKTCISVSTIAWDA